MFAVSPSPLLDIHCLRTLVRLRLSTSVAWSLGAGVLLAFLSGWMALAYTSSPSQSMATSTYPQSSIPLDIVFTHQRWRGIATVSWRVFPDDGAGSRSIGSDSDLRRVSSPNGPARTDSRPPTWSRVEDILLADLGDSGLFEERRVEQLVYEEVAAGWPALAVWYCKATAYTHDTSEPLNREFGASVTLDAPPGSHADTLTISLSPIWFGMLANATFYSSVVLALLLCTQSIARTYHKRHHRCMYCGYCLLPAQRRCPECGMVTDNRESYHE